MLNIFWFRRDLRLEDNHGLFKALSSEKPVQPIFIFDTSILDELENRTDARVTFIHDRLNLIQQHIEPYGASIKVLHGKPLDVFAELCNSMTIGTVFTNRDYEPYAQNRDREIYDFLQTKNIDFKGFKDHLIFEKNEITKDDGRPYTVYTPFSKKWKSQFTTEMARAFHSEKLLNNLAKGNYPLPTLDQIGFERSPIQVPDYTISDELIHQYASTRNDPNLDGTSQLSTHLRFGSVSVRQAVRAALHKPETFLNELIWREFFSQILWHFPKVVHEEFKQKYSAISWRHSHQDFERWKTGTTGYPMVDAGMRQLNQTGLMHNRLRMITAGFLCKHLLIDWRWGEAYFAQKLLDYELASNNGNWQWAAGTGCDAAPYFRIFNPITQAEKFDPKERFIRKWLPEYGTSKYPKPMVDHKFARERALESFKIGLGKS